MAAEGTKVPKDFYKADKPAEGANAQEFLKYEKKVVSVAQLAEKSERYSDMCDILVELVESRTSRGQDLNEDERNLLSVAFKNVVGSLRSSWRNISGDNQNVEEPLNKRYTTVLEKELETKCLEVLSILENKLVPACGEITSNSSSTQEENHVFYLKMCGDYYRYLAEFCSNEEYKTNAKKRYEQAYEAAKTHLPETHPTRLGLALNYSVCYYEILKDPKEACSLAKRAFDEAIQKLDTLNDANYKDSTLIMQLLRDNLTLWTSDSQTENED